MGDIRPPADPDEAREMLRLVAHCLRHGEPVPEQLTDWFATALETAAENPKAAQAAFGLGNPRHRRKGGWTPLDRLVLQAYANDPRLSTEDLAQRFGMETRKVQRLFQPYRSEGKVNRFRLAYDLNDEEY